MLLISFIYFRAYCQLLHQQIRMQISHDRGRHPRCGRNGSLRGGHLRGDALLHRRRPHGPRVWPHLPPRHRERVHLL